MKKLVLLLVVLAINIAVVSGKTWTVSATSTEFVFNPSTLTISEIDTVDFVLASIHSALEVSQATYEANGNTALAGGFHVPFGGGKLHGLSVGTHYFVCENHYFMGMKGVITVLAAGISAVRNGLNNELIIYPNPSASSYFTINYTVNKNTNITISLYDMSGKQIENLVSSEKTPGNYSIKAENRYEPGIYFVKYNDNYSVVFKKVVLY
jgi:plastocyanin